MPETSFSWYEVNGAGVKHAVREGCAGSHNEALLNHSVVIASFSPLTHLTPEPLIRALLIAVRLISTCQIRPIKLTKIVIQTVEPHCYIKRL